MTWFGDRLRLPSLSAQKKDMLSRQYMTTGDAGGRVSQKAISLGREIVNAPAVRDQPSVVTVSVYNAQGSGGVSQQQHTRQKFATVTVPAKRRHCTDRHV
jgi:hypothetical protein